MPQAGTIGSVGLRHEDWANIAVWRINGDGCRDTPPIPALRGHAVEVRIAFPASAADSLVSWNGELGELAVTMPRKTTARLLELRIG